MSNMIPSRIEPRLNMDVCCDKDKSPNRMKFRMCPEMQYSKGFPLTVAYAKKNYSRCLTESEMRNFRKTEEIHGESNVWSIVGVQNKSKGLDPKVWS